MLKKSLTVWVPALWIAAFLAVPVTAQTLGEQITGRYRVVDDATGEESVARLDLGRLDERIYILLTLFSAPEAPAAQGTYRVFAGFTDVGGLHNPYVRVQEAKNSYQMLKRPALILRNAPESLRSDFSCTIELGLEGLPFSCSGRDGFVQSGRMLKLRPTPPPVPFLLRDAIPGFYRVVDEAGGQEALARLEFKGNPDFSSSAILTLFSAPAEPGSPGHFRMFTGFVVSHSWRFQAALQELKNPYAQLARPVLLRTVPSGILVPGFQCSIGAPTTDDLFYSCQGGEGDVQSGSMSKLR